MQPVLSSFARHKPTAEWNKWRSILEDEFCKPYFNKLIEFVNKERETRIVFPDPEKTFRALSLCDFDNVKVVILGQDPYPGAASGGYQANGLAFAVDNHLAIPPSLLNIFKEIKNEFGETPKNHNLEGWARQGVLLLNTVLTVEKGVPGSHSGRGWEQLTDRIITELSKRETPVVFMLWGSFARGKAALIDREKHYVLEAPHPSPRSVRLGFFGCNHFCTANEILTKIGKDPINWIES